MKSDDRVDALNDMLAEAHGYRVSIKGAEYSKYTEEGDLTVYVNQISSTMKRWVSSIQDGEGAGFAVRKFVTHDSLAEALKRNITKKGKEDE